MKNLGMENFELRRFLWKPY